MVCKEVSIYTEDQKAIIHSNEVGDGLILVVREEGVEDTRLYLSLEEAKVLGKELIRFADEFRF